MERVVGDGDGAARRLMARIAGKTGTPTSVRMVRKSSHGSLASSIENPQIAVAVMVEKQPVVPRRLYCWARRKRYLPRIHRALPRTRKPR